MIRNEVLDSLWFEIMKDVSIKFKNYKCFGDEFQGFETILPLNIIIGRNNSGKSSLLDLIKYVITRFDLKPFAHKNQITEIVLSAPLLEKDIKKVFKPGAHGDGFPKNVDHWSIGEKWVGEKITVRFGHGTFPTFVDISKALPDFAIKYRDHLVDSLTSPFNGKKFKHLKAERDIRPEQDEQKAIPVDENGIGATNIIQQFVNKVSLPSKLVEETLLEELNKIIQPDASFTDIVVQQLENNCWEIFLEEKEKGRIALSQSGSGLKTILLVLIFLYLVPSKESRNLDRYFFAFEELENNVHPALQRRLFLYLREVALKHKTHFFITTHSNVVIDLFSSDSEAQLIHTTHDGKKAIASRVEVYVQRKGILDDLDVRASDLLQSNGVVWVEGPSDRLYFNKWIEIWSERELREGAHYQCVFYGGRLLAHLTANVPEEDRNDLIRFLLVNRNVMIMIDSDKKNPSEELNNTKTRIRQEMENIGAICWITKGKEIENYIPKDAIAKLHNKKSVEQIEQYQSFSDYIDNIKKGEGRKFESSKVLFAERVSSHLTKENLKLVLDLEERLNEVCNRIKRWNAL
ncbi:MAG: ATP-binding protein [Planctomycetes bacterium]|nr:ATP-binding protein [Planctomycetota bacterium]